MMIGLFLAAIQQGAATPVPGATAPQDLIRDIAAPVPVPMPLWQQLLIGFAAVLVVLLLIWLVRKLMPKTPAAPPPTPRATALRELERLRSQVRVLDPYAFSIAVSDVLRTYIGSQYGLRAREQTSPEFLASISQAKAFSEEDLHLLAEFLERSDLIKFARVQADEHVSEQLLSSAIAFVQGRRG